MLETGKECEADPDRSSELRVNTAPGAEAPGAGARWSARSSGPGEA